MLFALELVHPRWTVRILCIDMCMDMRVDMRIDMCTDVWLAMTVDGVCCFLPESLIHGEQS